MESMSRESGRFGGIAKAVVFGLQGPGFDSQHLRGFSQGLPAVVHPATPSIGESGQLWEPDLTAMNIALDEMGCLLSPKWFSGYPRTRSVP